MIEDFEKLLDDLSAKYDISTTRAAQILMGKGIRSTGDASFKDIDVIVQEALESREEQKPRTNRDRACGLVNWFKDQIEEEYQSAANYHQASETLTDISMEQVGGVVKKMSGDELEHYLFLIAISKILDDKYECEPRRPGIHGEIMERYRHGKPPF